MIGPDGIGHDFTGETIALQARHLGWNFHDKTLDAPRCLSKLAMPREKVETDQPVAATGYSCRCQASRLVGRELRHPMGLIARALRQHGS